MTKRKIDYSDLPELTASQLRRMKKLGRPLLGMSKRQLISIRLDPDVLQRLKKAAKRSGKGYQTLINEILAEYVDKAG